MERGAIVTESGPQTGVCAVNRLNTDFRSVVGAGTGFPDVIRKPFQELAILLFWFGESGSAIGVNESGSADLIRSRGNRGVVGFMVLTALHSFVAFPAHALAMASGIVCCLFRGSVITWRGVMIGALLVVVLSASWYLLYPVSGNRRGTGGMGCLMTVRPMRSDHSYRDRASS